jgi:hypothetical protein
LNNRQLVVISIASVAILLTLSTVYSNLDIIQAYAGETLSSDNVAKTIQVRVNPTGTNIENTFDSFSRIGFVQGEANFLLESVPSKDKKPFYLLVQKSLESKNTVLKNKGMNISMDIFSGNGEIIETLKYNDCDITEYFVHGVDSKGKIFFTEDDGTVEIREVTKFECTSFALEVEFTEDDIAEIEKTIELIDTNEFEVGDDNYFSSAPEGAKDGDLFYNSITNKLQRNDNGTWIDISGVGGPPSPRR